MIRSIEEGVPIIRATNSGISAVVDPFGRVIQKSKVDDVDMIFGKFPKHIQNRTVFYKFEHLFFFVFLAFSFIFIFIKKIK